MAPRFVDRFGLLLVLVLASICAQALIDTSRDPVGALVVHAVSGAALVVAVRAGAAPRRWRRAADVVVAVTLLVNLLVVVLVAVSAIGPSPLGGELAWLVAAALVPVAVARRVFTHRVATIQTIMGAVAAYLQIAVAYATAYQFLDQLPGSTFFATDVPTTAYAYVSLQTITTLGFGDLPPVTDLSRLVAVSEAVLGQVFLVTFVALVVARFPVGTDPDPAPRT